MQPKEARALTTKITVTTKQVSAYIGLNRLAMSNVHFDLSCDADVSTALIKQSESVNGLVSDLQPLSANCSQLLPIR